MAEFQSVIKQFHRMCKSHPDCDGCPLIEIDQRCKSVSFDCYLIADEEPGKFEECVMGWAEENPEPKYPTLQEYLWKLFEEHGIASLTDNGFKIWLESTEIPAHIAETLGIEPKEVE